MLTKEHKLFFPFVRFRLLCQSIIAHKLFDYVVLAFIFLNCITVALERPKILQGSLVRGIALNSCWIFQNTATQHVLNRARSMLCMCVSVDLYVHVVVSF